MSPSSKNKNSSRSRGNAVEAAKITQLSKDEWNDLKSLCLVHSTPGDERDAAAFLKSAWEECSWPTSVFGRYAVVAKSPNWVEGRPTVLLCAHLDSPGFIIQQLLDEYHGIAITLGGTSVQGDKSLPVLIKGRDGSFKGKVKDHDPVFLLLGGENTHPFLVTSKSPLHRGDRVCFAPHFKLDSDGIVHATFLDNRIGCWALLQVARKLRKSTQKVNVILAATAEEEMTGFGADVLSEQIHADVTICLDATYISDDQGIKFGGGPVLTVCDKSTLLDPVICKAVEDVFSRWKMPLQQEIYNYSGTDARAFPKQGNACPVLALLLATNGNHTHNETASARDVCFYKEMCLNFCMDDIALRMIADAWNSWGAGRCK